MSRPLLVILDGDIKGPLPALEKALRLAHASALPLRIWVNAYNPSLRQAARFEQSLLEAAKAHLEASWRARINEQAGDHPCSISLGFYKQGIAPLRDEVIQSDPALIVVATEAGTALQKHLFTPRDWQLIRKAPCPVLCVNTQPWSATPTLAAAIDPGSIDEEDLLSVRVTSAAKQWGEQLGSQLHTVHVMENLDETLVLIAGETVPDYARSADKIKAFHRDNFSKFASGQGFTAEQQHLLEGPIAATLANHCEQQKVDILVVGTVQRNLAERLLLGSTAEAVISKASCDVLVIKPEGYRSPWH